MCCVAWSSATSARWLPGATWSRGADGLQPPRGAARLQGRLEDLVNAEVTADRRIDVRVLPRAEALSLPDIIRTQSNLIPEDEQEIRIVDIVGLDVQADGGTHVASTRQIGRVSVLKVESKGKANRRVRVRLTE
jgi:misacylated tRNA(Ala) deacylase